MTDQEKVTINATRQDWKLQIRVGSAPIVPGGPVAEGNKWVGLLEVVKGGAIVADSAEFIDVDIMHTETDCTSVNATTEKDWSYFITVLG